MNGFESFEKVDVQKMFDEVEHLPMQNILHALDLNSTLKSNLEEIKSAMTLEEVKTLYLQTRNHPVSKRRAFKKMLRMAGDSQKELIEIWYLCPEDSEFEMEVILKLSKDFEI